MVGNFGVGLKDALATFDRNRISVHIESRYGDITTGKQAKHGFTDVKRCMLLFRSQRILSSPVPSSSSMATG